MEDDRRIYPPQSPPLRSVHSARRQSVSLGLELSQSLRHTCTDTFFACARHERSRRNFVSRRRRRFSDWLALFIDAKHVEIRDDDKVRPATVYVVIGLGRDGIKRILACISYPGRETLEGWRTVLRGLLERGVRRVMILVQDDFSGLLPLTQGFFPNTDVQLCLVHMQRNAHLHLPKAHAESFNQRITTLKASWSPEQAQLQFDQLGTDLAISCAQLDS